MALQAHPRPASFAAQFLALPADPRPGFNGEVIRLYRWANAMNIGG
ncbi:hypothetical protein ACLF3G_14360 [Falsiroseomonas sp. HC035]